LRLFVTVVDSHNGAQIGVCDIDITDCIRSPGNWKVDGIYVLGRSNDLQSNTAIQNFGEIYLQARFVSFKSHATYWVQPKYPPVPQRSHLEWQIMRKVKWAYDWNLLNTLVYQNHNLIVIAPKPPKFEALEVKLTRVTGDLICNVRFGKGLIYDHWAIDKDFCDPYVSILMPDEIRRKTKEIRTTTHPVWDELFIHRLTFRDPEDIPKIKISVLHKETMLGFAFLDIRKCVNLSRHWVINQWVP
jgi:hypothetical protein